MDEISDAPSDMHASTAGGSAIATGVDRRARTRRFALRGLAASGILALLSGAGLMFAPVIFGVTVLSGLAGLGFFLALVATNASTGPRLAPGGITLEGGTVRLLGRPRGAFQLADVVQGWHEDPDLVHLAMKGGEVVVVKVPSAAAADRLLRAAGVTAAERVLRVPLTSAASQIPGGSIFGGLLLALLGAGLFFAFALLAFGAREMISNLDAGRIGAFSIFVLLASLLGSAVYAISSALRRREAVVGTDGIAYRKTFDTEFISYGSLASVETDTRGVRLVRKGGRKVLLATRRAGERPLPLAPPTTPPRSPAEAQRRVLIERIAAAMAAGSAPELPQLAKDRLDRQGRSTAAWRDDLDRLLSPADDYRHARISPEDLGAVIEDPTAPAERRVAAAVALSTREGAEARRRVRIAVQACADEDLRAALEAAAEGEIEEVRLGRAMARRA